MAPQVAPPAKGMTARDYYNQLISQGMRPYDAYNAVQASFGPPPSPEQQAADQASADQKAQLAQTGGMIGGAVVANEALRGFPNVKGALGYGDSSKFAESGKIGITRSVPNKTLDLDAVGTTTNVQPKVVEIKGDTATIELPNGKTDVIPTEALNDSSFMSDIDWGKAGQAGMGALQLYQSYNMAKNKDYAGAGIYGAGGAANIAASGYAGAAAQTAAGDALGGYLVPGANILMGAYGAYQTAKMTGSMAAGSQRDRNATMSGAMAGAAIGSVIPVLGTGVGAAIGAAAGYAGSKFGSHKGKAQFMRDNIRGVLKEGGILDDKYQGTLADGTKYDFGKDGKALKWKEIDKVAAANPNSWGNAVALGGALANAYGFVGQKASDIAAWYGKAAISNAGDDPNTAIRNMQHFAQQQGITYDQIKSKLDEAIADNRISKGQYDTSLADAKRLTAGVKAPTMQGNSTPIPKVPIQQSAPQPAQPQGKLSIRDVLQHKMRAA